MKSSRPHPMVVHHFHCQSDIRFRQQIGVSWRAGEEMLITDQCLKTENKLICGQEITNLSKNIYRKS
jgi:hypothetical protein